MFNSNQETIEVKGEEYVLTLNRKGMEAIEKYTKVSKKKDELKELADDVNKDEYIEVISEDEDPFAGIDDNGTEDKYNELLEMLKRVLWICLWDNHHLSIEQVRVLLIDIIEENKLAELEEKIKLLTERVNKSPSEELKNLKALRAQK